MISTANTSLQEETAAGAKKKSGRCSRRRWPGMWIKPSYEEVSLCAEVTAYVYTK